MKHSTKPVFLCLFAVLFSGCLPQSAFKVAIKVIDEETGNPIPDALVFIEARAKAEPPREEPFDQAVVTAWGRTNSAGIARLRKVQGFHWGQEPQNQLWKMLESRKPQVKRSIASIDGGSVLVFAREYGALHHPFAIVDNPAFQERIKEGKYAGWMGKWGFKGEDQVLELNTKDLKTGKDFTLKMKKPESSTYLAACFSIYGLATIWPATSRKTGMTEKQQEQVYDYFVDSVLPTASVPVDKSIQDLLHPETRQWFINPEHLLGPATNHDTIIHNWLTQKAVEQLPAGYEEVKHYLQIIQDGVKHEDALSRPLKHFYNPFDPDSAMTGGESALKWGAIGHPDNPNNEWDYADAVRYYQQGDREKAYKALGHVLHLLEDLSVPMHTHIIPHEYTFMPGAALFETYFEGMIKESAGSLPMEYGPNAEAPETKVGLSEQFDAVAKLTFGKFDQEGQEVNFEDYYSWNPNSMGGLVKNPNPDVLQLMGKHLFPKVIGSGAALMKRFYDTLNSELSAQASQGKKATDAGQAAEIVKSQGQISSATKDESVILSATSPNPPGQSIELKAAELEAMPLDTLTVKVKGAKDKNERRQYVGAIYRFKPKAEKDISTLANLAAEDGGKGIASEAAFRSMENVGAEDKALAPAFVKLLDHKNGRVQYVAMEKCGLLRSKEALPKMIKGLKGIDKNANSNDDEWRLRGLVGGLGKYGKDGLPELLKLHNGADDQTIKRLALGAIQTIDDKETLPQFMAIVKNKKEDLKVRGVAIQMVGKLGAKESMPELMEVYKDEKNKVAQYDLIAAIGESKSEAAMPLLQEILNKDPDESNRAGAAHALEKIGGPKVIQMLEDALKKEQGTTAKMGIAYSLKHLTGKNYDGVNPNEK